MSDVFAPNTHGQTPAGMSALGSKADISACPRHVRFTPKADIDQHRRDVRFVPKADVVWCASQ
jgi:hypothetical protein